MLGKLRLWFRALFFKSRLEHELEAELSFHLEREIERNIVRGMSPDEARAAALRSFGGVERVKEESRDLRGLRLPEELWQDLRYGWRMLRRAPGFAVTAVLTLALGIGANTAIFSIVETVLVRPLPYREPERLVWLTNANYARGIAQTFLNRADILDYREQATTLEQIAAWDTIPVHLRGVRQPERLEGIFVTPNFFQVLGVRPILGRDFDPQDAEGVTIIISHSLWRRQFGGDPQVIGRKVDLDRSTPTATIVGVLAPEFQYPPRIELYLVYQFDRVGTQRGGGHFDRTIARLKPGVSLDQARAEIDALALHQAQQYPDTNGGWKVVVTPFRSYLWGNARIALPLMLGAVALVLLIACTNLANLQLARAGARRKEIALRLALGAGRQRIIRQLLTESMMLAVAGGGLGLLLAIWGLDLLRIWGPDSVPRLKEAAVNAPALGFATLITLLTGAIFGLVPARQSAGTDLHRTLKETRHSGAAAPPHQRFRNILVVSQIALAALLLTGAGLLVKSFWRLRHVAPGFQTERILTAGLMANVAEYGDQARRARLFEEGLERIARLPGVESVGAISHLPFGGRTMQMSFRVLGREDPAVRSESALADHRIVTPSFFETLRIPLKRGRSLTERDTAETPMVYLVNEAFARAYFPGRNPVGERIDTGWNGWNPRGEGEIVGVVGDVRHRGLEAAAIPTIYVSHLQNSRALAINYVVRMSADPAALTESVRCELQALDPNQAVFNVRPLTDYVSESMAQRRFDLWLLGSFAAFALLLAAVGVYGVMSYSVAQRAPEIGLRMALGAQPRDVLKLMMRRGALLTLIGVALGLGAAWGLTRLMSNLLFEVQATDPWTFWSIGLFLAAVALLAGYFPARRAMRVDPIVVLKIE
ncbi:MAG TPA: ABC transporter permease [Blastocatellia bacterium]|nr:ABC transporter permease [Blastocatellia bacterium]